MSLDNTNPFKVGDVVRFTGKDDVYREGLVGRIGTVRYTIYHNIVLVDFTKKQRMDGGWYIGVEDVTKV